MLFLLFHIFQKFAFLFNVIFLPFMFSCFSYYSCLIKDHFRCVGQQMVWMIFFVMIINHMMTIRIHIQTLNWELINKHRFKIPSGLISVLNQNGVSDLMLGLLNVWKGIYSEIIMQASLCKKQCMDNNTDQSAAASQIDLSSSFLMTSQSGVQRCMPILVCHNPCLLFMGDWRKL